MAAGTIFSDVSGNNNNGKIFGNTARFYTDPTSGFVGLNLFKDDFIEVKDSASLRITDSITIEAWIKPHQGNMHGVLAKGDSYEFPLFEGNSVLKAKLETGPNSAHREVSYYRPI